MREAIPPPGPIALGACLLATMFLTSCTVAGGAPNPRQFFAQPPEPAPTPAPVLPDQREGTVLQVDELFSVYQTIVVDYVEPVDHTKLIDGAFRGAREGALELGLLPIDTAILDDPPRDYLGDPRRDWQVFAVPYDRLVRKLERRIGLQGLGQAALRGMLATLDDPLTELLTPEQVARMQQARFAQVGVALTTAAEGRLAVREVVAGSPAEQAGLRPGDQLLAVDGRAFGERELFRALEALSGPDQTSVTVSVQTPGQPPREARLERRLLSAPALESRRQGSVLHLVLRSLDQGASDALRVALLNSASAGARGWILDLRGNNGGRLQEAVNVVSLFAGQQTVALEEQARGRRSPLLGASIPLNVRLPTVVLIDSATAGPAEMVAAALQDYRLATVVGDPTAGRMGSTTAVPLSDGSAAVISTQRYLSPTGAPLLRQGVQPDLAVATSAQALAEGRDPALERATGVLAG